MRTEWSGVLQQEDTGSDNSEVMRGEDGVELSQFYINEIRKQLEVGIYTSKHPQCQSQKPSSKLYMLAH